VLNRESARGAHRDAAGSQTGRGFAFRRARSVAGNPDCSLAASVDAVLEANRWGLSSRSQDGRLDPGCWVPDRCDRNGLYARPEALGIHVSGVSPIEMLCHLARNAFESINRHNTGDNSKRCCFRAGERLAEHCKPCGVCPTSAFGQTPDHAQASVNGGFSKSGDWAGRRSLPVQFIGVRQLLGCRAAEERSHRHRGQFPLRSCHSRHGARSSP
jgi:hypothetical protein